MKYWLSHLPLEVWVDCYRYPWITREELGRIVHRFGNRKYAEYLQFYLHDWGKRKLDDLHFDKDGFYKYINYAKYRLHFPRAPMPDNIKYFECIFMCHFDARTMNFLRQIGPILTDVNLYFTNLHNNIDNLRTILANLAPLMNRIHSLDCDVPALPAVKQCFDDKLAQITHLTIVHFQNETMDEVTRQTTVDFIMDWLNSPEHDGNGQPKLCHAFINNGLAFGQQICLVIRQEFLMAKAPRTFALILHVYRRWESADEFHLHNNIGEELHGVQFGYGQVQITRHRTNCGTEMEEWLKGIGAGK